MSKINVHTVSRDGGDLSVGICSRMLSAFANWHVEQCAPWQKPPARPRDTTFVREVLGDPEQWLMLATIGDVPAGIIHLSLHHTKDKPGWADRDCGYIEAEWVSPEFRRQGVGTALIEAAKQHFRELGVDSIETNVWEWNSASSSLHDAAGFKVKNTNLVLKL